MSTARLHYVSLSSHIDLANLTIGPFKGSLAEEAKSTAYISLLVCLFLSFFSSFFLFFVHGVCELRFLCMGTTPQAYLSSPTHLVFSQCAAGNYHILNTAYTAFHLPPAVAPLNKQAALILVFLIMRYTAIATPINIACIKSLA